MAATWRGTSSETTGPTYANSKLHDIVQRHDIDSLVQSLFSQLCKLAKKSGKSLASSPGHPTFSMLHAEVHNVKMWDGLGTRLERACVQETDIIIIVISVNKQLIRK